MADPGPTEVRGLRPQEVPAAVAALARAMRDNPLHVVAFGDDPDRRLRSQERLFRGLFRAVPAQQPICAMRDGTLVGVTGVAPVGTCQPTATQRLRLLPSVFALGPAHGDGGGQVDLHLGEARPGRGAHN